MFFVCFFCRFRRQCAVIIQASRRDLTLHLFPCGTVTQHHIYNYLYSSTHRPLASPPAPGVVVNPPPVDVGNFLRSSLLVRLVLALGAERRASRLRAGDVDAIGLGRRRTRHVFFFVAGGAKLVFFSVPLGFL